MSRLTQFLRNATPIAWRRFLLRAGLYAGDWLYLDNLRRRGLHPALIIDIGAYHGEWTRFVKRIFPATRVLMVEAQAGKRALLDRLRAQWKDVDLEIALLGPQDGAQVRFTEMETGSSVMEEGSGPNRHYVTATTSRLDSVLAQRGLARSPIDLLKLDVQGYELQVLLGADEALSRTEFVVLEASLLGINRGCPLITEVLQFMSQRGFVLIDIWSQVRLSTGALWQTDLLFQCVNSRIELRR